MSLNWKEIDLVLAELDLAGAKVERVSQPSFDALCLGLFKEGRQVQLLVSIAQGACRLHSLSSAPPKGGRALRFQECLRSRLVGGRIESIGQLGAERVIKISIIAPRPDSIGSGETVYKPVGPGARKVHARRDEGSPEARYLIYARLWSGASGNVLLVDSEGLIVDAMARRPKKGELSGEPCRIEEELASPSPAPTREFAVRDLPPVEGIAGGGSYNERVEAAYSAKGGELSRERLLETARERFGKRSRALEARIAELDAKATEFRDSERLRELGDILMANQGSSPEGGYLPCEDFYRGGLVRIPVEPGLTVVENARGFYERSRKARSGLAEVEAELASARASLERARRELAGLEALEDPFALARALAKGGAAAPGDSARGSRKEAGYTGLSLEDSGWTILVGRSAKENDELLRRYVKGSDLWFHARDWPGSYVFVKARKGKSVPLEILLDAGQLAIYYSKGRSNGGGDLYYTFAKYLRRAKDGPKGTVLPSQEKNLAVKLEEARLKELLALTGEPGD
jgi:predicted ribosome quality control (RQC) complex YloA/Tae2 family protein